MTAIIATILVFGVIGYAIAKNRDIPDSISGISYIVPHWLFSTWLMLVGILLMPPMMDALYVTEQWAGFLSIVGLACVASSPYYKTEDVKLHYIGAVVCYIFANVTVWLIKPSMLVLWLTYAVLFPLIDRKKWLLYCELCCFMILILTLLTNGKQV